MIRIYKIVLYLFLVASFGSLVSCETGEPVKPISVKTPGNSQNAGFILRRHLLTSFTPQNIYYNEFNQVKMVIHDGRYTSKYERYSSNGQNYIKSKLYSFGQQIREDIYTLNAQGKCVELTTKHLQFGGNVAKTDKYSFVYNADGKLQRLYNQAQPQEQTKFEYDAGNLKKVDYFKANGTAIKTITYNFTNDYHDSKIEDLYYFNPELENLDFNLRIFGTFFKHLPMREQVEHQVPNLVDTYVDFKYNLNPSGYPYLREKRWTNGSVETAYYTFKVVITGL